MTEKPALDAPSPSPELHHNHRFHFKSPTPMAAAAAGPTNKPARPLRALRHRLATMAQIGEDWLYLALLGTIMALLSFSMDSIITLFLNTRLWLSQDFSKDSIVIQYIGWCSTPIVLVAFSSGFVHLCSPTVS